VLVLEIKVNRPDRELGLRRDLLNGGGIKTVNGKHPLGGGQDVLRPPGLLARAAAAGGADYT